jgi:hypothetical protein
VAVLEQYLSPPLHRISDDTVESLSYYAEFARLRSMPRYRVLLHKLNLPGRVEDWRADVRLRWVFHCFRGGPQSGCHHHVSSPRRIERSVRFSRTTLTCSLRATVYETYATETTVRRSRGSR